MMKDYREIRVVPKKKILNDKGTVWESVLYEEGWNELPEEENYGLVVSCGTIEEQYLFDIYWPALQMTTNNVYADELIKILEINKKLSTEEFADKMGGVGFVRLDLYSGIIGRTIYETDMPPEKVKGFVEKRIGKIFSDLNIKPL